MQKYAWCLCLLVFLFLLVGSEGSKFKDMYPDYKDYQFQKGQSKANRWKEKSENQENGHKTEHATPQEHAHQHTEHPHSSSQQTPLPSQIDYLEYVGAIVVGAVLVFVQIRKLNKEYKQTNKTEIKLTEEKETEEERQVEEKGKEEEPKEEGEGVRTQERGGEEKGKEEEPKEESEGGQKKEREEIQEENVNTSKKEGEKEDKEDKPDGRGKEEEPKEEQEEMNKVSTGEGVQEGEKGGKRENREERREKIEVEECIVVRKEVGKEDSKVDSDEEWIVVDRSKTIAEEPEIDDEFVGMQLEPYGAKDPMPKLSTMLEKLQISVGPETPLKQKLQVAELIQKEKKLIIQQAQFTTNLSYKRRSLELQTLKEERSRQRELVRQNSLKEEIYLQQVRNDDYHKKIILHGSALIILGIWLKVMDFNLFTLPSLFLSPSSPASYLPSSLSSLYALLSWLNPLRLFYALSLFAVFAFLWMYVSSLAPYVVLLVAFMHAWQSLFRAGAYFFLLWVCAGGTFALSRRIGILRRYHISKLAILYILNLFVAGIVGSVVAHGDPLNPYRIHFLPDTLAEQLLAYLY